MNSYTKESASLISGEALAIYRRVKLSSGKAVYADAGEDSIGVTMHAANDASAVNIKLWNDSGTFPVTAAGTFAIDATLYGAADGKVDDVVLGSQVGVASEAATAAADVIEMIVDNSSDLAQQSHIADPAACADMTAVLTGVDTGTDMTAAQAATIVADFTAAKAAIDANNSAIDSILTALETVGITASS